MRSLLIAVFFTLLLVSCGNKMQPLETAGDAVTKCLNNCSLGTTSVSDCKENNKQAHTEEAVAEEQTGGKDHIQTIWTNHFNMW